MCEKDWVDMLSALLTPLVAGIAVYIAFQQWKTAERKRKQDLFDKRYEFYQKMWRLYSGHIIAPEECSSVDETYILDYVVEAEFLFGKDIATHILEIPNKQDSGVLDYDWLAQPFMKYMQLK